VSPSARRSLAAALLVAVAVGARAGAARADDRKMRAAEHFARAQAAEARKDWRAAIVEYEAAYDLSPHPSVLYNMALDYERLEEYRSAARHYLRYLDQDPGAGDREEVLARVGAMRLRPSRASFASRPTGARILIDGVERGRAPLALELRSGATYRVMAADGARRSRVQEVSPEYGDPIALTLDLLSEPGLLTVETNVPGAEVRLDGALVGRTPLSAPVPAGEHRLDIQLAGYRAVARQVSVPPQGSEQVRAALAPVDGGAPPPFAAAGQGEAGPGRGFLFDVSYGFLAGRQGEYRYAVGVGYRPSSLFELSAQAGSFGGFGGVGGEARLFLARTRLRPYLRAAGQYGTGGGAVAVEGGGGLQWGMPSLGGAAPLGLEYFIDVSAQRRLDDAEPAAGDATDGEDDPHAIRVPVLFGIAMRFGS
jgi:tetratricopeptide (TPR) repeat protein